MDMAHALKLYLSASFKVIERQQAEMVRMVDRLERVTRNQLIRHYGETDAWRGLAPDDFQIAYFTMKLFEDALLTIDGASSVTANSPPDERT